MKVEEADKEFEKYREALYDEAQRLASYIRLYHHLYERMRDRLDEMNLSPVFFKLTIDALFAAIVLGVDKLFGKSSERGFFHFLSFVENNRQIFSVDERENRKDDSHNQWMLSGEPITFQRIKNDRLKIEKIGLLSSLKPKRDRPLAKFEKGYVLGKTKLEEDASIKWGDLSRIVTTMADILNTYSAAYDGNVYSLGPFNINDVDRILEVLRKYKGKNS